MWLFTIPPYFPEESISHNIPTPLSLRQPTGFCWSRSTSAVVTDYWSYGGIQFIKLIIANVWLSKQWWPTPLQTLASHLPYDACKWSSWRGRIDWGSRNAWEACDRLFCNLKRVLNWRQTECISRKCNLQKGLSWF